MRISKLNCAIMGALLCAAPVLAQAQQASIHTSADEAKKAARLFRDMKADAQQIDFHSLRLEMFAKDPNTNWAQFDQEWNGIKPAQEMLEEHLRELDGMRASLTEAQRKAVDQTKQAAPAISARTRELINLIDKPNADLRSPSFRSYAQSLAKNAETVLHASSAGA
jgi:regulator of sigma D